MIYLEIKRLNGNALKRAGVLIKKSIFKSKKVTKNQNEKS